MRSRGARALPARLATARRRFEQWRRTREGRSRIPDTLWASAVKLCATYGIYRTAQTLRLNPDSLKKHVAAADGNGSPHGDVPATFVELLPSAPPGSADCNVELEDARGVKMRIQVTGSRSPDVVAAVSRIFLGVGP